MTEPEQQVETGDPVDRLTFVLDGLRQEAAGIRTEIVGVRKDNKLGRKILVAVVALIVLVGVLVGKQFYDSRQRSRDTRATLDSIQSCVQTTGKCYQELQKRGIQNTQQTLELILNCYDESKGDKRAFIVCLQSAFDGG